MAAANKQSLKNKKPNAKIPPLTKATFLLKYVSCSFKQPFY